MGGEASNAKHAGAQRRGENCVFRTAGHISAQPHGISGAAPRQLRRSFPASQAQLHGITGAAPRHHNHEEHNPLSWEYHHEPHIPKSGRISAYPHNLYESAQPSPAAYFPAPR